MATDTPIPAPTEADFGFVFDGSYQWCQNIIKDPAPADDAFDAAELAQAMIRRASHAERLVKLLLAGWTCEKFSLYDEEGVEGWVWTNPEALEDYTIVGSWDALPPIPEGVQI